MSSDLDLLISGNNCSLLCRCSRFQVSNYDFIIETWLTKAQLTDLNYSITPGAVSMLYEVLGKKHFYDTTWQGNNTITFTPTGNSDLKYRVNETTGYCRNITTRPLEGDSLLIECKLECAISGSSGL